MQFIFEDRIRNINISRRFSSTLCIQKRLSAVDSVVVNGEVKLDLQQGEWRDERQVLPCDPTT